MQYGFSSSFIQEVNKNFPETFLSFCFVLGQAKMKKRTENNCFQIHVVRSSLTIPAGKQSREQPQNKYIFHLKSLHLSSNQKT